MSGNLLGIDPTHQLKELRCLGDIDGFPKVLCFVIVIIKDIFKTIEYILFNFGQIWMPAFPDFSQI